MDGIKRYSPMKYTKSINQRKDGYSPFKKNDHKLNSNKYFCHFSNGMYMGGAESFKKSGQGIMLLDDGSCMICSHSHDNMVGHNIIFRNQSITSLLVDMTKNKNVCFRINQYLLQFSTTNRDQIEGPGYFIDYSSKKIFKLTYKHSKLQRKIKIVDEKILKKVFDERDATGLIHVSHARALDFDFDLIPEIKYVTNDNDHAIGFCEKEKGKRGLKPKGLSFRMTVNQRAENFDIKIQERGYFENNLMQHYGQRIFENGNLYVGGFDKGQFEGHGVLYDPNVNKWTYGIHRNGELVQVLDSSVKNKKKSLDDVIREIHKTDKTYIQSKIVIKPAVQTFHEKIEQIFKIDPFEHDSSDHATLERLRNQYLKRIQHDYTNRHYERNTEEAILKLIPESKTPENKKPNKSAQKFQKTNQVAVKYSKPRMKTMAAQEKNRSKSKNNKSTSKKNKSNPTNNSNEKKQKMNSEGDEEKKSYKNSLRAERYLKSPNRANELINKFYESGVYPSNLHEQSAQRLRLSVPYDRSPQKELEQLERTERVLKILRLQRELDEIRNLKSAQSELDRLYMERTAPFPQGQNNRYLHPDDVHLSPIRHDLLNTTFQPQSVLYRQERERSRSRGSSSSLKKRYERDSYKYFAEKAHEQDELYRKILIDRYLSPERY